MNILTRAYWGASCYGLDLRIYPSAAGGITESKINKRETDVQEIIPYQSPQGRMALGIRNDTRCIDNGRDAEAIQIMNDIDEGAHLLFRGSLRQGKLAATFLP